MTPQLVVILENIRSAYNVGSVFRICDGAGVDKLILTGLCAHPPHPKLEKTALGSTASVAWEYHDDIAPVLAQFKQKSYQLSCLEVGDRSQNLFMADFNRDTCLIFGNETTGVSAKTLAAADQTLQIPMLGSKTSLNISTSAAVAIYQASLQLAKFS